MQVEVPFAYRFILYLKNVLVSERRPFSSLIELCCFCVHVDLFLYL